MRPDHYIKLKSLFQMAVELSRSARSRFVERVCQNDGLLREELLRLLAADEQAGAFLESPALLTVHSVLAASNSRRPSTSRPPPPPS